VGLVQREIEAAGFSTISLSMMPELTMSAGVPRIAAIEHPFGLTLGRPQDVPRQLAVLSATLRALEEISQPGTVVHLPFEWESREKLNLYPPEVPPISQFLRRHPWYFSKFLNRTPRRFQARLFPEQCNQRSAPLLGASQAQPNRNAHSISCWNGATAAGTAR
jgi:betaine reductase